MTKSIFIIVTMCLLTSISTFAVNTPIHNKKCLLTPIVEIRVYGESHNSPNAKNLRKRLLGEASQSNTRLFLEALPPEVNSDNVLKVSLFEGEGIEYAPAYDSHIFGIDSLWLKAIDILGATYIDNRDNKTDESTKMRLRQLFSAIVIQKIAQDILLRESFKDDDDVNWLRTQFLTDDSQEAHSAIDNTAYSTFGRFLLRMHGLLVKKAKNVGVEHPLPVEHFAGSAVDYLKKGMALRDEHMAEQIETLVCASKSQKPIAVIVGRAHLENLRKLLVDRMYGYTIVAEDIESNLKIGLKNFPK